jgi:hypothetical protein
VRAARTLSKNTAPTPISGWHEFGRGPPMDTTPASHPNSDGITKTLAEAAVRLLRRGVVSLTVRPSRSAVGLADFPDAVGALAKTAGLVLFEEDVAVSPRDQETSRASGRRSSPWTEPEGPARQRLPRLVVAHEDLVAMRHLFSLVGTGKSR